MWYPLSLDLRDKVLRRPLGLKIADEDLTDEVTQVHFIATENDAVVGTVTLIPHYETNVGKLRQMATIEHVRGKGYGKDLVSHLENFCIENGMSKISLHARHYAVGFYENLGYTICSEAFEEVNIKHFAMQKSLI